MPTLKNYHLVISHSWTYAERYETIRTWLDNAPNFQWSDYSVCCNKPLDTKTDAELKEKLKNRISLSNAVIVISGMYATYSKWIDFEIDTAIELNKPIIGVRPWGQERIPTKIQDNSTTLVGWNSKSVIDAVRNYSI